MGGDSGLQDGEIISRLLSGNIDPAEIESDSRVYEMAERIYGRDALEGMGVNPPEISFTISSPKATLEPEPFEGLDADLDHSEDEEIGFRPIKRLRWVSRRHAYFLSFFIQISISPFLIHDWDGFVFIRTAEDMLAGQNPYETSEIAPTYIFNSHTWPALNTWYAYPPLPLIMMIPGVALANSLGGGPAVVRMFLKVPFIFGNLALAYSGSMLLRSMNKKKWSRRWEIAILFNPYLWLIAAVWGMFDAWMAALLFLSFYFINEKRDDLAAFSLGLASLTKIFPIILAPIFFSYLWANRDEPQKKTMRFTAISASTFIIVSLPFIILHPSGFYNQVVWMHAQRPPQGLSAFAVPEELQKLGGDFELLGNWILERISEDTLATLPLALLLGLLIIPTISAGRKGEIEHLISSVLMGMLAICLTSKVVNEQYLVLPVALFGLLGSRGRGWYWIGYRLGTFGGLVAAVFLGWHLFTFIPYDISMHFFGKQSFVLLGEFINSSEMDPQTVTYLPYLIALVAVAPFFILSFFAVLVSVRGAFISVKSPFRNGTSFSSVLSAFILAFLVISPSLVYFGASNVLSDDDESDVGIFPDDDGKLVGTYYYLWWANTAHDPTIVGGNWEKGVTQTPEDGYYTTSAGKIRGDFITMKENGIDLVVISFHEYTTFLLPAVFGAAEEVGLLVAPLVELHDIYSRPEFQSLDENNNPKGTEYGYALREDTKREFTRFISAALSFWENSPAAYMPKGELGFFLYDSHFSGICASVEFQDHLVRNVEEVIANNDPSGGPPWIVPDLTDPPTSHQALMAPDAYYWKMAFASRYVEFWEEIRGEIENNFGGVHIISGESWGHYRGSTNDFQYGLFKAIVGLDTFDSSYIYSPSFIFTMKYDDGDAGQPFGVYMERYFALNSIQSQYQGGYDQLRITSVAPSYNDTALREEGFVIPAWTEHGNTFDIQMEHALSLNSDIILISTWNEFYEGSGVEPSERFGDYYVESIKNWSRLLAMGPEPTREALILTNEAGANYYPGASPYDWTLGFGRATQTVVSRVLSGFEVSALDLSQNEISPDSLNKYDLIVIENGPSISFEMTYPQIANALEGWVTNGGSLVILGAAVPPDLLPLWGANAIRPLGQEEISLVKTDNWEGTIPILEPWSDRNWQVELATGSEAHLWFDNGDVAAWSSVLGNGSIVGTSFKPTDLDPTVTGEEAMIFCRILYPLMESEDSCVFPSDLLV